MITTKNTSSSYLTKNAIGMLLLVFIAACGTGENNAPGQLVGEAPPVGVGAPAGSSTPVGAGAHVGDQPTMMNPKEIAKRFAPAIVLSTDEQYFPSSLQTFSLNTSLDCHNGFARFYNFYDTQYNFLPPDQTNCYLQASLHGPYDVPEWLKGTNPAETNGIMPIYIDIYELPGDDRSKGTFVAQYNAFFPYNFGKNACVTFAPNDHCLDQRVVVGNHIGDWELITIRFHNGIPTSIHVGAHGNDIPDTATTFYAPYWTNDKRPRNSGNLSLSFTDESSGSAHPIVYAAQGSHGMWSNVGRHNYKTLATGEKLNDYTSEGYRWETWKETVFTDSPEISKIMLEYTGRWGNPHMGDSVCKLSGNLFCSQLGIPSDEYQLNDGPRRPIKRDAPYME